MTSDTGRVQSRKTVGTGITDTPVTVTLHLSPTALPAFVSSHYVHHLVSRQQLEQQSEKARESFGKPGRDPSDLSVAVQVFARQQGWGASLRLARMSRQWEHVVGAEIAANTSVGDFRDGVLTIRAKTPVWATQLLYLLPTITKRVKKWLAPSQVVRIEIRGGRTRNGSGRNNRYSRGNRYSDHNGSSYGVLRQTTYHPGQWG